MNLNIYFTTASPNASANDKSVAIFGGGDSALDWAIELSKSSKVFLIHRRDDFRGTQSSIDKVKKLEKEKKRNEYHKEKNRRWFFQNLGSFSDIPSNGREGLCVFYYKNGEKEEEINYKNGEKNGVWNYYYEDNQLKQQMNYQKGLIVGELKDCALVSLLLVKPNKIAKEPTILRILFDDRKEDNWLISSFIL